MKKQLCNLPLHHKSDLNVHLYNIIAKLFQ